MVGIGRAVRSPFDGLGRAAMAGSGSESEPEWAVKVQSAAGQCVVRGASGSAAGGPLLAAASRIAGAPPHSLTLKTGFPPRALDLSQPQQPLGAFGLQSGDTVIVEYLPPPLPPPAPNHRYKGLLTKRVVPSDNSCLFTSVGFVLNGRVDTSLVPTMRKIIAETVSEDKLKYCEAFLGRPNQEYSDWIQRLDSWGGAIELSILSNYFGIEIVVVNALNAVINRFGEDINFGQRVFLLFDGIHYDPLYSESSNGVSQTIFDSENIEILNDAEQLAKSSHPYTDIDKIQTKCLECGAILIGQKNANQHAIDTSHTSFSEF